MKYIKMTGRREVPANSRELPFEKLISELDADGAFVRKYPKGAQMLRMLLEATYTKGYMDAQTRIVKLGGDLSNGWQSLTGGATWQEVEDAMIDDEVPIPDDFYRYINGESLEVIFGDMLVKAEKEISIHQAPVKEFFMNEGDRDGD